MDIRNGLDQQLKVAEVYKKQGLYDEAKKAFGAALKLIEENPEIENRDQLLSTVNIQIQELKETAEKVESAPATPEIAPQVQTLIKNLFASPTADKDPDVAALEGAITLAKFGQIDRAVSELTALLEKPSVRMTAAKNIFRCYQLLSASEKAIETYQRWLSDNLFSPEEIDQLRKFLEKLLEKGGKKVSLPTMLLAKTISIADSTPVVFDAPDIGSVTITLDNGPLQGKPVELDVQLQAGNLVSLIIESKEKSILDSLSVGFRLKNIQYNSSVAIFRGDGVISAKALIDSGPKQGDYHLDIKIEDS
jgi:tetratricopeptide (TPR) repeat protein